MSDTGQEIRKDVEICLRSGLSETDTALLAGLSNMKPVETLETSDADLEGVLPQS